MGRRDAAHRTLRPALVLGSFRRLSAARQSAGECVPLLRDLHGQMFFVGTPTSSYGRSQGPTQWKDFGPRVGFAYNAFSKTVFRAGFGISYAPSALQAAGTTGAPGVQGFGSNTVDTILLRQPAHHCAQFLVE